MARFSCSLLVLLALLGSLAGATAAATFTDGGGCEVSVSVLAVDVAASCAAGAPTPPCCEPVLASVELGGGACLCRLASETPILHAGLNVSALAALYAGCGGGAATSALTSCHGAPPSGSAVLALPSSDAGVAKDRVGGMPTHEVIRVIRSLSSDVRETVQVTTVTNVIGLFLWLIIAAVQVYRCVYGRKG